MQQFIPFDDRWFDAGEALPGPLVPYHVGFPALIRARTTTITAPRAAH